MRKIEAYDAKSGLPRARSHKFRPRIGPHLVVAIKA